jgi:hypothetical protein
MSRTPFLTTALLCLACSAGGLLSAQQNDEPEKDKQIANLKSELETLRSELSVLKETRAMYQPDARRASHAAMARDTTAIVRDDQLQQMALTKQVIEIEKTLEELDAEQKALRKLAAGSTVEAAVALGTFLAEAEARNEIKRLESQAILAELEIRKKKASQAPQAIAAIRKAELLLERRAKELEEAHKLGKQQLISNRSILDAEFNLREAEIMATETRNASTSNTAIEERIAEAAMQQAVAERMKVLLAVEAEKIRANIESSTQLQRLEEQRKQLQVTLYQMQRELEARKAIMDSERAVLMGRLESCKQQLEIMSDSENDQQRKRELLQTMKNLEIQLQELR